LFLTAWIRCQRIGALPLPIPAELNASVPLDISVTNTQNRVVILSLAGTLKETLFARHFRQVFRGETMLFRRIGNASRPAGSWKNGTILLCNK
jgi:hypothetical protein